MNKVRVSRAQLRTLFDQNSIWTELLKGGYTCPPRDKVVIPVKEGNSPVGGCQVVHKWHDILGRHVVTTHAVLGADGWPVHWDEKDVVLGDTKFVHRRELDD